VRSDVPGADTQVTSVTGALSKKIRYLHKNKKMSAACLPRNSCLANGLLPYPQRSWNSLHCSFPRNHGGNFPIWYTFIQRTSVYLGSFPSALARKLQVSISSTWLFDHMLMPRYRESAESMVVQAALLSPDNAAELVTRCHLPYSFLRKQLPDVSLAVGSYPSTVVSKININLIFATGQSGGSKI